MFLITKDISIFDDPSDSLRLAITDILEYITRCNDHIRDYARKSFIGELKGYVYLLITYKVGVLCVSVRAVMQNKKTAIEDLEARLKNLKKEVKAVFIRQGIIETRTEARGKIGEELLESGT